ncbi:MAG: ABC transporter permease [Dehalococcoidia bacterium]
MIRLIFTLTLGQLIRQRRALLLALLAAIPIAITLLFRFASDQAANRLPEFVAGAMDSFIVAIGLPLTALILGTAALGQEFEDGTAFYLFSKPISRWQIVVGKLVAAWLACGIFVAVAVLGTGAPLLGQPDEDGLVVAFVVATVAGALAYSALFIALSIRFNRALVIGLAYVFVWEGLVSNYIEGVRFFSLRAYTRGIADALTDAPAEVFEARLDGPTAAILTVVIVLVAAAYAVRRLNRYEFSERV